MFRKDAFTTNISALFNLVRKAFKNRCSAFQKRIWNHRRYTSVTHIYIYRKFLKVTCCDQISILLVTIFFCFHDIQYILLEYITVSHFYFLIPLRYNKNIVANVMWPLTYIVWKKYLCFIFAVLEKIYYRIKFVGFMLFSSILLRCGHQKNGLLKQKIRGSMKPILWDLNLCFDSFLCPLWWRINEQLN